ncbi:M-phase phosphoprotein 6 [Halyomorpha halys]|uniref:M-phase phosphoprotein 6 n=1 Tax=Halyomorpha halys TaxID=286706 RepID=UPI0006D52141|nr:M-phase phosphoprotein 6 [Halyomorpha halys]
MPKDRHGRTRLSKSVLEMKFMQRSKQRILAEEEADQGRAVHENEITEEMKNAQNKFIIVPSYVPCQDLIIGRVSYGGMNPEIEKLMAGKEVEPIPDESNMEKDITNWEMLKLSSVAQSMANKFSTKKSRNKAMKRLKNEK